MQPSRDVVDRTADTLFQGWQTMKFPCQHRAIAATIAFSILLAASSAPARQRAQPPHSETSATTDAVIEGVDGRRAQVRGAAVARWPVGMPVVVREAGEVADALQLAAGVVLTRAGDRAIVLLEEGAPPPPIGAQVEPRWVHEARVYGGPPAPAGNPLAAGAAGAPAAGAAGAAQTDVGDAAKPAKPQVWHATPGAATYGSALWLEVVATPEHAALTVRWRLGRTGAFADLPMTAGPDGRWSAQLAIGEPDPDVDVVEYYVGAEVTLPGGPAKPEVIVGHAAEPRQVPIQSAPGYGRRVGVDHQPPERWTHQKALPVVARVDRRFRDPTLLFRARGGGTFEAVPMQRVGGDVFRAEIPAERVVLPGIAYAIRVTDAKGMSRDGWGSEAAPHTVHVTRGTVLSPEDARNRVALGLQWVRYDGDDSYIRTDVGLERMFFGFLVGRLQAEATIGNSPQRIADALLPQQRLRLYGGSAGLEVRVGDYLGLTGDVLMAIHGGGAGIGYAVGARIGDESGSHLTVDWRSLHDLETSHGLVEQLRVALSVPVGRSLRLDGVVVHEDLLTDASRGLRFALEAGVPLGSRLFAIATAGFAGRDADQPGATAGMKLALTF